MNYLHIDGTNTSEVIEFVTNNYKNRTITNYILEIDILQKILLIMMVDITGTPKIYPNYGAIFPLYNNDKYHLDYTGSYHLNLSLPYSISLLTKEEELYNQYKNKVNILVDQYIFEIFNNKSNNQIINIVNTNNIINTIKTNINIFYPKINEMNININILDSYNNKDIEDLCANINILDNIYFVTYYSGKKHRHTLHKVYYIYNINNNILIDKSNNIETNFKNKDIQELFLKLVVIKSDIVDLDINRLIKGNVIYHISNNKLKIKYIPRIFNLWHIKEIMNMDTSLDYINIDKQEVIISLQDSIIKELPTFSSIINTFTEEIIISNINSQIKSAFSPTNSRYNIDIMYELSPFHKLHKIWAISIQWILPLVLSCYSSCDPFSIGDNDKLTELSLRSFISGFSFFNLSDIFNFNLYSDRDLPDYQIHSTNMIEDIKSDFNYNKTNYDGSDFRVSIDDKGFGFGFELRVFDNCHISNIEYLLELFILLADHTVKLDKDFSINPFNHPVLNIECIKLLKQGWNTIISKEYLDLIHTQLDIEIIIDTPLAYNVINFIYIYLQKIYVSNGKGIGIYSKYLINRKNIINHLPNINKQSWEWAFNQLVWLPNNPNTDLRIIIESEIKKSNNISMLKDNLLTTLGIQFREDIDDILYSLEKF